MIKSFIYDDINGDFSANCYVIGEKNRKCIIVDPGIKDDTICRYIDNNYLGIGGILITHGHFDHIGGLSFLQNKYNAPIFIYESEIEFLNNSFLNCSKLGRKIDAIDLQNVYGLIDGEIFEIEGMRINVIHTPFHTSGSSCFYFIDCHVLFSGDTLFARSIGRSDLPTSSPRSVSKSLKKLDIISDNTMVYPGHGEISMMKDIRLYNHFLRKI